MSGVLPLRRGDLCAQEWCTSDATRSRLQVANLSASEKLSQRAALINYLWQEDTKKQTCRGLRAAAPARVPDAGVEGCGAGAPALARCLGTVPKQRSAQCSSAAMSHVRISTHSYHRI